MRRSRGLKLILCAVCLILLTSFFTLNVFCEMPDGYRDMIDGLGDEVEQYLPDGMHSSNTDDVGEAVEQMTGARFWMNTLYAIAENELKGAVLLFARLCGLVVIAAVFSALERSMTSGAMSGALRFCTTTAVFAAVIGIETEHLNRVSEFFGRLYALMGSMIPITSAVWAMGGNVSTATSSTSTLYIFLNVCEGICGKSVVPVCCLFSVFALCNSLSSEIGLSGLSGSLKKSYTTFLGIIMTVLVASLASSTVLTSAADSTSARAAKIISANVIPVVGASVGDTLRTVATSVQYLKGIIGIGGTIFIALMLLPLLVSLLLTRSAFLLAAGVARAVGCGAEGSFLSELGGVYSIMVAVVSMSSVMFIFALTIFSKTVVAIA